MTWHVRTGHVLEVLASMEPESVQTCVTSPPYWGLRDYGDGGQEWPEVEFAPMPGLPLMAVDPFIVEPADLCVEAQTVALGLEPDPWAYVGHLVEVFRAVRRVLRDDGTLWLNLGDSYNAQQGQQRLSESTASTRGGGHKAGSVEYRNTKRPTPPGLKPKDLCGIPWRVAFALQADGWYLRSDIIWHKPNPMPESITDRPTKAHEYLFLMSKGPRYFYDIEAIREDPKPWNAGKMSAPKCGPERVMGTADQNKKIYAEIKGANARSVWTITTRPYPAAHFATFPPELPERCIKAGTRPGDLVLDVFSGAGTTGMVATRLQRSYIGIEQSETYAEMSRRRIEGDAPLFNRQGAV